jgi:hypothetical protein
MGEGIGGVDADRENIPGDGVFQEGSPGGGEAEAFGELEGAGAHGDVGVAIEEGGNPYATSATGYADEWGRVKFKVGLRQSLGDGEHGIAALDSDKLPGRTSPQHD